MSTATETTTAAVNSASKKATEKAAQAAAAVAETLPTVVATEEITATVEVPTKVVLNQSMVVITSALAGAGVLAAGLYGWKKFQEIRAKKAADKLVAEVTEPAGE